MPSLEWNDLREKLRELEGFNADQFSIWVQQRASIELPIGRPVLALLWRALEARNVAYEYAPKAVAENAVGFCDAMLMQLEEQYPLPKPSYYSIWSELLDKLANP